MVEITVCLYEFQGDYILFDYFFQSEDGIRDWSVTGVQTCALPICLPSPPWRRQTESSARRSPGRASVGERPCTGSGGSRSEERRVGKERRFWWSGYIKK